MRIKQETKTAKRWGQVFLIFPRVIDGHYVFFERVWKRKVWKLEYTGSYQTWVVEYGLIDYQKVWEEPAV